MLERLWTEKSTIVPYQLLFVGNKKIFFVSGVSEKTEKPLGTSVIFRTKEGDCSETLELTLRSKFSNFVYSVRF